MERLNKLAKIKEACITVDARDTGEIELDDEEDEIFLALRCSGFSVIVLTIREAKLKELMQQAGAGQQPPKIQAEDQRRKVLGDK